MIPTSLVGPVIRWLLTGVLLVLCPIIKHAQLSPESGSVS